MSLKSSFNSCVLGKFAVNLLIQLSPRAPALRPKPTRFRAYQLGSEGSSFSYFDGTKFTLIEARITEQSSPSVMAELQACGVSSANCLHITSWDADHCKENDLKIILTHLDPKRIEYPGYEPSTETGKACLALIQAHKKRKSEIQTVSMGPDYIKSLDTVENWGYRDIVYHPKKLSPDSSNDNSTVQLFRIGSFTVASLGDVESQWISSYLKSCRCFKEEVDVMILAHHGADNGFTTSGFLRAVRPSVAISSSDFDNRFKHPRKNIKSLLYQHDIPIFTTKTGDVIIHSLAPHTHEYRVTNLKAGSQEISSVNDFTAKKSRKLGHNMDTVRQNYTATAPFYRRFRQ